MPVAEGYEFSSFFSDFGKHLCGRPKSVHKFRSNFDEKQEGTENVTKTGKFLRPAGIF